MMSQIKYIYKNVTETYLIAKFERNKTLRKILILYKYFSTVVLCRARTFLVQNNGNRCVKLNIPSKNNLFNKPIYLIIQRELFLVVSKNKKRVSKLLKKHFKSIKFLFFFPDFSRLQGWGGWVRPNLENSRFFFF